MPFIGGLIERGVEVDFVVEIGENAEVSIIIVISFGGEFYDVGPDGESYEGQNEPF